MIPRIPLIFMVGLVIPTLDLGSIFASIIHFLGILRQQLSEVVDRIMHWISFLAGKGYDTAKFIVEFFPYDNYSRTLMLALISMLVIASLLALFGVSTYTQPKIFSGFQGIGSTPNPNAVNNPADLTIGVGSDALRERVGESGSGLAPRDDPTSVTTLPIDEAPDDGNGGRTFGDTDEDGVPDQSDTDIDGDGIPNDIDLDIDGDGADNRNDQTPCGEYINCPTDIINNSTLSFSVCGNGICQEFVVATRTIFSDIDKDDNILYYDVPYWCTSGETTNFAWYQINERWYYGVVGTSYLKEMLNEYCTVTTSHELYYAETLENCPNDCIEDNRTATPYPEWCINGEYNPEFGEEDTDCGGQCVPCHCTNGLQDFNETGIDCGADCPDCSCSPTGYNIACASQYCCPEDTGICANRCVLRRINGVYVCCHPDLDTGAWVCTEEDCHRGCELWNWCTLSQPQIENPEGSTISGSSEGPQCRGGGALIWS